MGKYQFTSKSVEYGDSQEPVDRGRYIECIASCHPSFHCSETRNFVYMDFPYLTTSSDGVTECNFLYKKEFWK